ncbi:hypothetical protein DUI87_22260 [Hirundo rustica rustica]|uniref:Retroviral nucleocapsid Gag protein p24 C-terminal domain-containing protein n=1 Tax=Hirundo rustica rustica TaxID=333673 RepID=A0A3M0JK26_HIRRU|nr:hypothetical protein DUI87_22260 [Hirundo rustica rustica]
MGMGKELKEPKGLEPKYSPDPPPDKEQTPPFAINGRLFSQKNQNSWHPIERLEATRDSQKLKKLRVEHVAEEPHAGIARLWFSFGLKKPIGVLRRSPLNSKLLPEKATTCSWSADPGNRDWKPFLHQKGQSQAKGVIGKVRKDSSALWMFEPFVTFLEQLTRAIELQVKEEGAQEQVLEEMALAYANEQCKAAILSLSIEPAPTVDDMLQQMSPEVMIKDPATRKTKSPHDQVAWGHGYAYVSIPSGVKWMKPFIPKSAMPPAEAPQVSSAAWRRRKC